MKLTCTQFNVLWRAYDGTLKRTAAAPSLERTVASLSKKGLIENWSITEAGRALLSRPYYRKPDDSVEFGIA